MAVVAQGEARSTIWCEWSGVSAIQRDEEEKELRIRYIGIQLPDSDTLIRLWIPRRVNALVFESVHFAVYDMNPERVLDAIRVAHTKVIGIKLTAYVFAGERELGTIPVNFVVGRGLRDDRVLILRITASADFALQATLETGHSQQTLLLNAKDLVTEMRVGAIAIKAAMQRFFGLTSNESRDPYHIRFHKRQELIRQVMAKLG